MRAGTPEGEPLPGQVAALDLSFIHRTYRSSLVVAALAGFYMWEPLGAAAVGGLALGTGISLLGLAGWEALVRRYLAPGRRSLRPMVWLGLVKLLLLGGLLGLGFWGALAGRIQLLWIIAGLVLPHSVLVLKLAGRALAMPVERPQPRRRGG